MKNKNPQDAVSSSLQQLKQHQPNKQILSSSAEYSVEYHIPYVHTRAGSVSGSIMPRQHFNKHGLSLQRSSSSHGNTGRSN